MTMRLNRRRWLTGMAALGLTGCATLPAHSGAGEYVTVEGQHFKLKGKTYRFVAAPVWPVNWTI